MEHIKNFLEVIKLSTKSLIGIALICLIILFLPQTFLEQVGLFQFFNNAKPIIFLFLIISITFSFVNISSDILGLILKIYHKFDNQRKLYNKLRILSKQEKEVMLGYLLGETKTQYFCSADGVIVGLASAGLVIQTSYITTLNRVAYNIDPSVFKLLNKDLAKFITQEEIESFKKSECNPENESFKRANPFTRI